MAGVKDSTNAENEVMTRKRKLEGMQFVEEKPQSLEERQIVSRKQISFFMTEDSLFLLAQILLC